VTKTFKARRDQAVKSVNTNGYRRHYAARAMLMLFLLIGGHEQQAVGSGRDADFHHYFNFTILDLVQEPATGRCAYGTSLKGTVGGQMGCETILQSGKRFCLNSSTFSWTDGKNGRRGGFEDGDACPSSERDMISKAVTTRNFG